MYCSARSLVRADQLLFERLHEPEIDVHQAIDRAVERTGLRCGLTAAGVRAIGEEHRLGRLYVAAEERRQVRLPVGCTSLVAPQTICSSSLLHAPSAASALLSDGCRNAGRALPPSSNLGSSNAASSTMTPEHASTRLDRDRANPPTSAEHSSTAASATIVDHRRIAAANLCHLGTSCVASSEFPTSTVRTRALPTIATCPSQATHPYRAGTDQRATTAEASRDDPGAAAERQLRVFVERLLRRVEERRPEAERN